VTAEALEAIRSAAPDVSFDTTDYDLGARLWHRTGETLPEAVLE
jgi:3-isopropylmalate dehydrogenase